MDLDETLSWPFFDDGHRRFAQALARWADATLPALPHDDVDAACRARVEALGEPASSRRWCRRSTAGCIRGSTCARSASPAKSWRSATGSPTSPSPCRASAPARSRCSARRSCKARYLPPVRDGRAIAAFALSEPEAGSDVAALATTATPDGPSHLRIDGEKTWISNGGIADHYVVFARTGEGAGAKGLSAFVVDADTPGLAGRRAHRGDRAASAGDPALRRRAGAAGQSPRQAGRRLQGRDGDARHLPLDRRRRRARLRPPRAARDRRARRDAASCSARRSATCR